VYVNDLMPTKTGLLVRYGLQTEFLNPREQNNGVS